MKSYTMTAEQASRYDADDVSVFDDIKSELNISGWTAADRGGDSVEIYHPDGHVAQVLYGPAE